MTDSPIIIDDFMPQELFMPFAYTLMVCNQYSPADCTVGPSEKDGSQDEFGENLSDQKNLYEVMFQAVQYRREVNQQRLSDFYIQNEQRFDDIKKLLNIKNLFMIRTNCTVGQHKSYKGAWHTDLSGNHFSENYKVAILYLNSNNGGTEFEDKTFVESKVNRCVVCPASMKHRQVWHTNAKLRYVMNINYEEN